MSKNSFNIYRPFILRKANTPSSRKIDKGKEQFNRHSHKKLKT